MSLITTRFEINVLDKTVNPADASTFAIKHNCPTIVTTPDLVAPFIVDRSAKRGLYKIIVAVDYPTGANFALQKLRGLSADAMAADGFDIVRSNGRTPIDVRNEVKAVNEFIKQVNPVAEIRWVLRAFDSPNFTEGYLKSIVEFPCHFVRNDQLLARKGVNVDDHKKIVDTIRKFVSTPIKLSCNIDHNIVKTFMADKNIRFDVSLNQALAILKASQSSVPQSVVQSTPPSGPESLIDGEKIIGTLGQDVK